MDYAQTADGYLGLVVAAAKALTECEPGTDEFRAQLSVLLRAAEALKRAEA
jgi:hypothetical protein